MRRAGFRWALQMTLSTMKWANLVGCCHEMQRTIQEFYQLTLVAEQLTNFQNYQNNQLIIKFVLPRPNYPLGRRNRRGTLWLQWLWPNSSTWYSVRCLSLFHTPPTAQSNGPGGGETSVGGHLPVDTERIVLVQLLQAHRLWMAKTRHGS